MHHGQLYLSHFLNYEDQKIVRYFQTQKKILTISDSAVLVELEHLPPLEKELK